MGHESGIGNDMKVGSVIKVLEKYKIVGRGMGENETITKGFRGRGITLLLGKKPESKIPIDWDHQLMLKSESQSKLIAMKKFLFTPQCRKRFILNYFSDITDLEKLPKNCGMCDYCMDQKKGIIRERVVYSADKKETRKREKKQIGQSKKTDTYEETLRLFREGKNPSTIADER